MKTYHTLSRLTAPVCLFAFVAAGCSDKDPDESHASAPATSQVPVAMGMADKIYPEASASANSANPVTTKWTDIKGTTYEMRESLFAGLQQLETLVDGQIAELKAKREVMDQNDTSARDWDFAMKEMDNSRAYFKSVIEVLNKTDRETWDQQKERVGRAWVRTQDAFAKVKASTTQ